MTAPRACGRLLSALVALTLLALALWMPAAAQAAGPNAVQGLPGCEDNTLTAHDDVGSELADVGFEIDFYGDLFSQVWVNNNGNVTFTAAQSEFTPFDFTTTGDPMIAPFFADVDTRGLGSSVVTYGQTVFDGRAAFCVNWVDVGYYDSRDDKLNSFQLLLVQVGTTGDFDIVMNYDRIAWETGEASGGENGFGGTSAEMGFAGSDGDPAHFHVQPGSFENGAFLDSNTSTGLIHGSRGTSQLGRYIFPVRNAPVPGPKLTGTVTENGTTEPVPNAFVEICRTGGSCVSRQTNSQGVYRAQGLTAGDYEVTAHPSAEVFATPGRGEIVLPDDGTQTLNIELGPAPEGPPAGTDVPSAFDTSEDGLPVVLWTDPVELTTAGCAGGAASYTATLDGEVVRSGSMTEGPAGEYSATMDPLAPNTGFALISIEIDCPVDADDASIEFGIYIDPSGWVRNSLGDGIEGATVTLYRSHSPAGPFTIVPDGSAIMSPSNRVNPDLTDATGHFGWDVVAGYYKVRAEMEGCVSNADRSQPFVESRIMEIPPPVFDLDLRLYCGEGAGTTVDGGGQQTGNPVIAGGSATTSQQTGTQSKPSPCAKLKGKRKATCQRLQKRLAACQKISKKAKRKACAKRARALAKCEAKKSKKKKASCVRAANRIGAAKGKKK